MSEIHRLSAPSGPEKTVPDPNFSGPRIAYALPTQQRGLTPLCARLLVAEVAEALEDSGLLVGRVHVGVARRRLGGYADRLVSGGQDRLDRRLAGPARNGRPAEGGCAR